MTISQWFCPCGKPARVSAGCGRPGKFCSSRCAARFRKQRQRSKAVTEIRHGKSIWLSSGVQQFLTPVQDLAFARLLGMKTIHGLLPVDYLAGTKELLTFVEHLDLKWLSLPQSCVHLAHDALYHKALLEGAVYYGVLQSQPDENGDLRFCASPMDRADVLMVVRDLIHPSVPEVSVLVPLVWNVGFAVGFLSALSLVQVVEAEEGMTVLVALVVPLLSADLKRKG